MNQKKILGILSLLLWIIAAIIGIIQSPLQRLLASDTLGYSFNNHLLVYQSDSSDTQAFFRDFSEGNIPFTLYKDSDYAGSMSDDSYWFLIKGESFTDFVNSGSDAISLVEIAKPQLDHIDVYLFNDTYQIVDSYELGRNLPYAQRYINHRNYFVPIDKSAKISSVLFRVKTESYLQFPVTLWHERDWSTYLHRDLFGNGLFYGALFIMLIYNLILGISIKDKNNIYFSLFIASFTLMQGTWDGFTFQFLWPSNGHMDLMSNPISINLVSLTFFMFSANLFSTKDNRPLKNKLYQFVLGSHFIGILCVFLLRISTSVYFSMFNALLTLITSVVFLFRKGIKNRTEMIYLMAWEFFLAANLLNIFAGFGLLPYTIITAISPKIAIIGLISLFSLALSEKFNTIEYLRGVEIEKRRILKALHEMHKKISSTNDIHVIFDYLLDMFGSITKYEEGLIVLVDEDTNTCDVYSNNRQHIQTHELTQNQLNQLVDLIYSAHNASSNIDIPMNHSVLEQFLDISDKTVKSLYLIPLINLSQTIGFILLSSPSKVTLDYMTKETIDDFATQIAITLNNTKLFNKVNRQAQFDALTVAYNRRYFFELAESMSNEKKPFDYISVLMIDIDDFKQVNDTHGHMTGDIVLKTVVERIISLLDTSSIIGRYGGEEFIVLHRHTDADSIHKLSQSILLSFRDIPILIPKNEITKSLDITISIGLCSSNRSMSVYELADKADALLYQAKEKGKDQICHSI